MLIALNSAGDRIWGAAADRREAYSCPICHSPVILKQGRLTVAHFAHRPGVPQCEPGEPESPAHLNMKATVYQMFARQSWVRTCTVEHVRNNRRVDVWLEAQQGPIAIECQVSSLSVVDLSAKLSDYARDAITCLYLVHSQALGLDRVEQDKEVRVPAWVRALHALYFGRAYVYLEQTIYPFHFDPVRRSYEEYDHPDYGLVGGGTTLLKATKRLSVGTAVQLDGLVVTKSTVATRELEGTFLIARFKDRKFWSSHFDKKK